MKKVFLVFVLWLVSITAIANDTTFKSLGLKTTEGNPCYLTNGDFTAPTISLMVAAYSELPNMRHVALTIIDVALKSDCDINLPNNAGLSPLNDAILFNEPKVVDFLLKRGAEPTQTINTNSEELRGLNSYQFIELLETKNPKRKEIQVILQSSNL